MRYNSFFIAACASMLLASTTSCSLWENIAGKVSGGNRKIERDTAVLPNDRENIQTPASTKTYSPEELGRGIVKGDWAIETVYGKPAVGEKAPFIKFVPSEKRIYGNNGCNVINASYKYNPADSTLSFSGLISTMMACGKTGITDVEIGMALDATRFYSWKLQGSEYHLSLFDENHQEVMTMMHQNFEFLNGAWKVTAIEGEPVNVADMKLVIDVAEGKLHGNTGCNILNGTLETDMDAANSISFQAIGTTRMTCPDIKWETPFIVALEDACTARPVSKDRVLLLDSQNKIVLQLDRIEI